MVHRSNEDINAKTISWAQDEVSEELEILQTSAPSQNKGI